MGWRAIFRPGMRAYFIPLVAGIVLAVSAFLPWVVVGEVRLIGFPDMTGLWIIGLGDRCTPLRHQCVADELVERTAMSEHALHHLGEELREEERGLVRLHRCRQWRSAAAHAGSG